MGTVQKTGRAPGTPIDTRQAISGGRVTRNGPSTHKPAKGEGSYSTAGKTEVKTALAGLVLNDTLFWRNNVAHASILEGGRRFSPTLGRMIGSEQAPDGFLRPAIEESEQRMKAWKAD